MSRSPSPPPPPTPPSPPRGYELVWEGKYDGQGRRVPPVPLPPDVRLTLDERYAGLGQAFDIPSGWTNRLILGDNRAAAALLLPEFRGAVQLVYLDPPFDSDADYAVTLGAPGGGPRSRSIAYRDRWGGGASYAAFMAERLSLCRELLAPSGCLFLHCDWHSHAPLRLLLDEIFGADHFVNEIVWYYYNKYSRGQNCLPRAHDTILLYGRTRTPLLHPIRLPRAKPQRQLVRESVDGVLRNAKGPDGHVLYRTVHDKKADDVWTIPQLQPASGEWTGYATQKHPRLLERILELASRPGDLVADLFAGSGTTLAVAQRMNRRFVGCDAGAPAIHIAKRRLIAGQEPRPGLDVYALRSTSLPAPQPEFAVQRILDWLGAVRVPENGPVVGRIGDAGVALHPGGLPFSSAEALRLLERRGTRADGPLVCCAGEFEPGFWEGLEAAGVAGRVLPVCLPGDPEALSAPLESPPCLLPRATVESRVEGNRVRVTLAGFGAPALADVLAGMRTDATEGLDAVDLWAVDPGWQPGAPFQAAWFTGRPSKLRWDRPRQVPLTTPGLERPPGRWLLVKAWDGLGRAATCVLP